MSKNIPVNRNPQAFDALYVRNADGTYAPISAGGSAPTEVSWDDIEDKPSVIASGTTQAEARTAIGAGTGNSNLALGTTSTTAKRGDYQPAWGDVTDKPSFIASGATQAEARAAIGAGTSNLAIGTTATTAKAGNAVQTATQTTATAISPGAATNVQGILEELAARITALEGV